jgi:hypothetical protein
LTAYLGLYRDVRKYLLAPDQHRHEVGEDVSKCRNCLLASKAREMSPFEAFCWTWTNRNVNATVIEAGLLGRALDKLGLSPIAERLLIRAVNDIRQFLLKLDMEDARR